MAALFTKRANRRLRLALLGAAALALGTPSLLMAWVRSPLATGVGSPVPQPVPFDHRHHVLDASIDCRYCHSGAERSRYAGVPPTSLCMGCHAQIWNDSPLLAPVQRSWVADRPIAWNRVHSLPGFVYFDHSAHLTAGVGCASCHGSVERMAQVYPVAPLTMEWCLDCHRDPERHLGARARGLRRLVHCSTCHR